MSRSREIVTCGYCDSTANPWKGKQQYLKQHVTRKHPDHVQDFHRKPRVHNDYWAKFMKKTSNEEEGKSIGQKVEITNYSWTVIATPRVDCT